MSIVVYYVDGDTTPVVIKERFLTFHQTAHVNAESLTTYIFEVLSCYNLNVQLIVSQGWYDGALVMSGACTGVQKHVR